MSLDVVPSVVEKSIPLPVKPLPLTVIGSVRPAVADPGVTDTAVV